MEWNGMEWNGTQFWIIALIQFEIPDEEHNVGFAVMLASDQVYRILK
jgi:hypothetical protein